MPNISKFVSSFTYEVSRPCLFDVSIPLPAAIQPVFGINQLHLRCEATELPGRTFAMAEQKTYGPVQRFPIQNAYDNIQFTFICSGNLDERKIFDAWMNLISEAQPNPTGRGNFDFQYKTNYAMKVRVIQRDLQNSRVYEVDLIEAFPFAVNPISLNWADLDSYNKLSVMFNYTHFEVVEGVTVTLG